MVEMQAKLVQHIAGGVGKHDHSGSALELPQVRPITIAQPWRTEGIRVDAFTGLVQVEAYFGGTILFHPQHEGFLAGFVSSPRTHGIHLLRGRPPTTCVRVRQEFWKSPREARMSK